MSHCLNSAETLFLSFTASKAQVIGRKCSVVPWEKMTDFKSGSSEEFCACYEKRTHYHRAPSLHCFILLQILLCMLLIHAKILNFTSLYWRLTPLFILADTRLDCRSECTWGCCSVSLCRSLHSHKFSSSWTTQTRMTTDRSLA